MTDHLSDHAVTGIPLAKDYSLEEVAQALGMSTRWIRDRIKGKDAAEHIRYGHKIRFTAEQVEKLRARYVLAPKPEAVESVTTGRKKRAS
jgi:predicted DNA-binding protein YlxM (UPF0122 family)